MKHKTLGRRCEERSDAAIQFFASTSEGWIASSQGLLATTNATSFINKISPEATP
jgi:hypothetical protein